MTNRKIRHEFSADAGVSARLKELVQKSGATKTDIIVQAIKAFAERSKDNEFSRMIANRFDILSHEIEAVRRDLEAVRHDLEAMQQSGEQMQADVKTILDKVAYISSAVSSKTPLPSEVLRPPSHGLFGFFR
jgi:archaellum component FlaC